MKYNIEIVNSTSISGWLVTPNSSKVSTISIFDGNYRIAQCQNTLNRPDLVKAGLTAEGGGFRVTLDRQLSENQVKRLRIIHEESGIELAFKDSVITKVDETNTKHVQGPIGALPPPWVPKPRSKFGGLWTDLDNAHDVAEGMFEMGNISEHTLKLLHHWIDYGFVILENAVDAKYIDTLLQEWQEVLEGKRPNVWIETFEQGKKVFLPATSKYESGSVKLLDLYSVSEAARNISLSDSIMDFMSLVFMRPPVAFQSLSFWNGTEQPIHQDTAYVKVTSPMELVASWVALEDITEGSGELQYYPGSQFFSDFLWDGKDKWKLSNLPGEGKAFLDSLHVKAEEMDLPLQRFLPKKGDVLIWSADLAHGGSPVTNNATRKSLVTHYCPKNCNPSYFYTSKHSTKVKHAKGFYCYEIRGGGNK